jgi:hypothetical protein
VTAEADKVRDLFFDQIFRDDIRTSHLCHRDISSSEFGLRLLRIMSK